MQKSSAGDLKIHARILPAGATAAQGEEAPGKARRTFPKRRRAGRGRAREPMRFSDRLLRNTAVACALLLGVLSLQNIDQPWSRLALRGVRSAVTMRIDLDESLGRLSFVRELMPESALVFLDISEREAFAPASGVVRHAYNEAQPWIVYQCEPRTEVRALEPGQVTAVTELQNGEWGVLLDHGGGVESVYAYLSEVRVKVGETASAGDVLGLSSEEGDTGLYFEMRLNGEPMDPAERLKS